MSTNDDDSGPGLREVAYRLFAAEYDDASLEYSESDEERAPNYVVTPTGARVNRLFVVGVLTAVESVNEDTLRARIVDPTGAFVVYAGQYQPEALAFFERAEPPAFVAITGKANTFQPDGSDRVLTSLRPEEVNEVDAETRDRWVLTAAEQTLERIGIAARTLDRQERGDELETLLVESGIDDALAKGIPRALDHYQTSPDYLAELRQIAVDSIGVVAGHRDEVQSLSVAPDAQTGEHTAAVLAERDPTAPTLEDVQVVDADSEQSADTVTEEMDSTTSTEIEASVDDPAIDSPVAEGAETETSTASDAEPVEATAGATGETVTTSLETETTTETDAVTAGSDGEGESEPTTDTGEGSEGSDPSESAGTETIGNFEPSGTANETSEESGEGDTVEVDTETDPEELYEIDDEEREEIESEYGVEFSSGTDVEEPGEADIDVPATAEEAEKAGATGASTEAEATASTPAEQVGEKTETIKADDTSDEATDSTAQPDASTAERTEQDESVDETESTSDIADPEADSTEETPAEDAESAGDADVDEVLLDQMDALDDGDGADREAVIEAVTDATGASEEAVADAIDDALMSGQCYEPDETTLKPI